MDFVTVILILSIGLKSSSSTSYNVIHFGAVGDGVTNDSPAFMKAWKAACGALTSKNHTLIIPKEKTFLLNPMRFKGPCKSSYMKVQVLGNIVAPNKISAWKGHDLKNWLIFSHISGLTVNGNGEINGEGHVWWGKTRKSHPSNGKLMNRRRPTALEFSHCSNIEVNGLKHKNSQRNHITIFSCRNASISNLTIVAPSTSPNTDGIVISKSTHVHLHHIHIATGDDCVAVRGGSSHIYISEIACGPGHGISIGSLGANGEDDKVEEIYVRDCSFERTQNGVRIKTWQGGSGYARKIHFERIELIEADNPIIIDQFYCPSHHCKNHTSAVEVRDIVYMGVRGTSMKKAAINFKCSQSMGCTNITLHQINVTSTTPYSPTFSHCFNAHGKFTTSIPPVDCLLE